MTMHICHPSLSTTGKKRGKKKFRNSDAAQRARQQKEEWDELKQRWGCENSVTKAKQNFTEYKPKPNPLMQLRGSVEKSTREASWDPCVKQESRQYTGDKIVGIGTLHKSNAVPVFSEQEAKDLSSMRR